MRSDKTSTQVKPEPARRVSILKHGVHPSDGANADVSKRGGHYHSNSVPPQSLESVHNNNTEGTKSQTDNHVTNHQEHFPTNQITRRPVSDARKNHTGNVTEINNHVAGSQTNSQTISAFMHPTLPSYNDTTTPSIVQGNTNQTLYLKTQPNQQARNRDSRERQGRHRVSVPQCASDVSLTSSYMYLEIKNMKI